MITELSTRALPDGAPVNRYADNRTTPRHESKRKNTLTAHEATCRPAGDIFRDLRSGARDRRGYSSRWMADGKSLKTIQTTTRRARFLSGRRSAMAEAQIAHEDRVKSVQT
jgi:neutral trehalase